MTDVTAALAPLGVLAPFAGHWAGSGEGHYPTIEDFAYDEQVNLTPIGKPFLTYLSRTRKPGGGPPMHTENGYLRLTGGDSVELLVSQPTGFVEIHQGEVRDGVLEMTALTLSRSPNAKPVHEIRRRWVVAGDLLTYDMWMAHDATPLTHHLHAELRRQDQTG
ncbi:hypothetical protein BTZ20_4591 [Rhodococcus sp. MTM3W5.2]|uniref:FABP family protein n=1 Tax=Rhodococcus sp. MTM3W5.2 TaxID=1805827 RepID=UPI00097976FF|nr:FABP family protein [Rhodococcus sp. MTM3W5.2]AQA20996.1 hypothetical protein BTZ20_4591 [Rhodococcus sp. MTM3W5.2]